jgi:hypothetical protein
MECAADTQGFAIDLKRSVSVAVLDPKVIANRHQPLAHAISDSIPSRPKGLTLFSPVLAPTLSAITQWH